MANVVSQSRTMWVKKGEVVNGKTVSKGYLAQYGKPAKKVTAKVQMETQTGGVAKGDVQAYSKGRRKTEMMGAVKKKAAPATTSSKPSKPAATGPSAGTNPKPKTNPQSDTGAAKPAASKNIGYTAGKGKTAASKNIGYTAGKNTMRSTAGKKQVVAGTPNTAAKKYKTPGPDLGVAFEAWKAKPAISAKDRERAAAKAKLEKAARQKAINLMKSKGRKG